MILGMKFFASPTRRLKVEDLDKIFDNKVTYVDLLNPITVFTRDKKKNNSI